jgi:hypothetical protein
LDLQYFVVPHAKCRAGSVQKSLSPRQKSEIHLRTDPFRLILGTIVGGNLLEDLLVVSLLEVIFLSGLEGDSFCDLLQPDKSQTVMMILN